MRVSESTSNACASTNPGRTRHGNRGTAFQVLLFVGLVLALAASAAVAGTGDRPVQLRSGVIEPNREAPEQASGESDGGPRRFVVRFRQAQGWFEKGALETAGARVETALPGQAYLVTVPAGRTISFAQIPGVDWATPYMAQDKISPEIAAVKSVEEGDGSDVIVLLHLFRDAAAKRVAAELTESGLRVEGARGGTRFGRVVLRMTSGEVETHRADLAAREDVFWIERRHRRVLANDDSIWVGQSGLFGGGATPVFNQGIYGTGQVAAILDTGLDADMCYFRDDVNGLPPTNTSGGTTVDPDQRKVIAVDFLDPAEDPADPAHWDTHGHGTFVAGILAGDNDVTPIEHDPKDGMAPGAKLVIQDGGFANDDCGDLPGIGCPVTDLNPIFQQAYDQGARVHNNSWNDNENASVQNLYTDASEDVDEFMWNNPDFLILFAAGNQGWPDADNFGTIGSPGTAKNGISIGATYAGENSFFLGDISSWGPTSDGRIKPDVVFPGQSVHSADGDGDITTNNCGESGGSGTSYASPGVAGNALLVREYFMEGWYPTGSPTPADAFTPSAALIKAMLINSAVSIQRTQSNEPITIPHAAQGWGRILLDNSLHFSGQPRGLWVDEHAGFTGPSDPDVVYMLEMEDTGEPLKITLAWTDFPSTPAATTHLVNDLDLRVDGASGDFVGNNWSHGVSLHGGAHDRLNNLEQVLIEDPLPGLYSIRVSPHAVPSGPQPFVLVVSGGRFSVSGGPGPSYLAHSIDDSGANGNGDGVLDPGETAKIPIALWNAGDAAATSVLGNLYSAYPDLLKVYDATSPYADMAVGGQASSTAPHYEVTLEPSASCGQVLGAHMSITGDGFEVGSAFAMDIGVYESNTPSTDTPASIPRSGSGSSSISVPSTFPLTEVDVTVNIAYGDIGDLDVLLDPPGTTTPPIFLHNNSGSGVSGIHTTYDELTEVDGPGHLDDLIGTDPQGAWQLRVNNSANKTGTIESWTLHLKSDIPFSCNPVGCGEGVPSAVGDTLTVAKSGGADVQVSWSGVGSSSYNVWRSGDPRLFTAAHAGATGSTSLVDGGAQNLPGVHYYVVRSVNSCGWESD